MLKRFALVAASHVALSTAALADGNGRVLSESDTGVVFGDLDCPISTYSWSAPVLHEGDWGYLFGYVEIDLACLTDDGRTVHMHGSDDVWFPTVTWDRASQSWQQDGVTVATRRDFRTVELNPALDYTVRTANEETQVSFNVQVRTKPAQ